MRIRNPFPSSAISPFEGPPIPDIHDKAYQRSLKEQYVDNAAREAAQKGDPDPVTKTVNAPPEKFGKMNKGQIEMMSIALERMSPGTERDDALKAFRANLDRTLATNPQSFAEILNSSGEEEINNILGMLAARLGTPPEKLVDIIAAAKAPKPMTPPTRVMPGVGPAIHAGTGKATETQPITTEQQALFTDSDLDIMNKAAAARGWDGYANARPEDVMFIYHNRTDLPAVQAAAKGALERTGHLP